MLMGTRKKGFTLIELLVVIAIIAILAAILFPIFVRVQESARLAKCLNNVKQIAGGCMLYEGDYDSTMLQGFNTGTWGDWYSLVNPYIKQMNKDASGFDLRGVWLCPNIPKSVYKIGTPNEGEEIPSNLKRAYGYNHTYLGGLLIPNSSPPMYDSHKSSELFKSTKTIRVLEIWAWGHQTTADSTGHIATKGWGTAYCYPPMKHAIDKDGNPIVDGNSLCVPSSCWPPGWHSGGRSVVGWCDGHVSSVVIAPPQVPGGATAAAPFSGIMAQYLGGVTVAGREDPYFRLTAPKP